MIVGFTGTRNGITTQQSTTLVRVCSLFEIHEFHHGDCLGSDSQMHNIIRQLFGPKCIIHSHPPINILFRAFTSSDVIHKPKEYLDRNHDIVDVCDGLLATPKTMKEEMRAGTWSTIRYAWKKKKPITIIYPDGSVS